MFFHFGRFFLSLICFRVAIVKFYNINLKKKKKKMKWPKKERELDYILRNNDIFFPTKDRQASILKVRTGDIYRILLGQGIRGRRMGRHANLQFYFHFMSIFFLFFFYFVLSLSPSIHFFPSLISFNDSEYTQRYICYCIHFLYFVKKITK